MASEDEIAIVGIGCNFPGGKSLLNQNNCAKCDLGDINLISDPVL